MKDTLLKDRLRNANEKIMSEAGEETVIGVSCLEKVINTQVAGPDILSSERIMATLAGPDIYRKGLLSTLSALRESPRVGRTIGGL